MSIVLIGEPLARASSAADPAVEPTSIAPERSASLALLDPADWTQLTVTPWSLREASSQPFFLMTRLSGLYVAKSMLSVPLSTAASAAGDPPEPSPATQPVRTRAADDGDGADDGPAGGFAGE